MAKTDKEQKVKSDKFSFRRVVVNYVHTPKFVSVCPKCR